MLSGSTLLHRDQISLTDVRCRHGEGRGRGLESAREYAVVFVRRGCFVRATAASEAMLDPTLAFCVRPGDQARYDHPHAHGDDCTSFGLEPELAAALWGGEPELPVGALPTPPRLDLEHRLLLAVARRGGDAHELVERAVALIARTLETVDPRRADSGAPATGRARRAIVDGVRELLAENPDRSLPDLARAIGLSPQHLSRVFRSATGHTIARHRMRLRARTALEQLGGGRRDLGRLAADTGFADQSHMCRVLRSEVAHPPSQLRRLLMPPLAPPAEASAG